MSYASEKLYKGYLLRKMGVIVRKVKPMEILPWLPCLTDSDREEIGAKKQSFGDNVAMQHLLDCLKRRENWVEDFISGLEACDHHAMAEEMRAEYDSLKLPGGPKRPSYPAANVTRSHFHLAPSDPGPAPVAPRAEAAAYLELSAPAPSWEPTVRPEEPPSPAPQHAPALAPQPLQPLQPRQAPPSPFPQIPPRQATPPPPDRDDPVHREPEENTETYLQFVTANEPPHREATPPPPERESQSHEKLEETSETDLSFDSLRQEATPPSPQEEERPIHREPEEMSEPAFPFGASDETAHCNAVPPPPERERPAPEEPVEISEPDPIQFVPRDKVPRQLDEATVKTLTPELSPLQSPTSTETDPSEAPDSMSVIRTPEKLPVQETAPPTKKVLAKVPVPEDVSGANPTQVTRSTGTTLPAVQDTDGANTALSNEDDDCMSKPLPLLSINQSPPPSTHQAPSHQVPSGEPCSVRSEDLQYSGSSPPDQPVAPAPVPAVCSASPADSAATCQENGVIQEPHNEPEENYYNSSSLTSLGEQEVLVHEVHVSEEASMQNLNGQTPSLLGHNVNVSCMSPESSFLSCDDKTESVTQDETCAPEEPQAQILNDQVSSALAKEPESAPPTRAVTVSIVGTPSTVNCCSSNSGGVEASVEVKPVGLQDQKEKVPASNMSKYILTAAGVGACAMLVAWKLKN